MARIGKDSKMMTDFVMAVLVCSVTASAIQVSIQGTNTLRHPKHIVMRTCTRRLDYYQEDYAL